MTLKPQYKHRKHREWYMAPSNGRVNPHGYSDKAKKAIADKMKKMKDEDKPHDQKIAIAISEAKEKGYKVPKKK